MIYIAAAQIEDRDQLIQMYGFSEIGEYDSDANMLRITIDPTVAALFPTGGNTAGFVGTLEWFGGEGQPNWSGWYVMPRFSEDFNLLDAVDVYFGDNGPGEHRFLVTLRYVAPQANSILPALI